MPELGLMERIARAPIMCDGATKTQLVEQGFNRGLIPQREYGFSTGLWNVEHPEVVEAVHRDYLAAGAELILTNTFKISSFHVLKWGRARTLSDAADESVKLVHAATKNARRACGDRAWVLGDVAHIVSHMDEGHRRDVKIWREEFKRQARAMRDAGADAIIVEYMADPAELSAAVEAAKQVADWPVMATAVFANRAAGGDPDYRTHRSDRTIEVAGATIDEMIKAAVDAGADVVGAHCGPVLDVSDYLAIARRCLDSPHRPAHVPVIIQPNGQEKDRPLAGAADTSRSRALADAVERFLDLGVRILGGCCGTTPQDVRTMSDAMRRYGNQQKKAPTA